MKVLSITTNQNYYTNTLDNKGKMYSPLMKESVSSDSFILSKPKFNSSLAFTASPIKLDLGKYANKSKLTGKEAIEIFENFRYGNFLDLNGGSKSLRESKIRIQNLSFFDKVVDECDKAEFVEYYKELTGFPCLYDVANSIKNQFKNAVVTSEKNLKNYGTFNRDYYEVLGYGYDGVSSVARYKALPSSDLDKAYVILRGHPQNDAINERIVGEFRAQLWNNTDQRILSYNHDADSFPKVYTDKQVLELVSTMQIKEPRSFMKKVLPSTPMLMLAKTFLTPQEPTLEYNYDYVKANEYFIKLCKKFPVAGNWDLKMDNISRENVYSFGFILEALKCGEAFKKYDNYWIDSEGIADYVNLSQIRALKAGDGNKEKYDQREKLANEFESWEIDKQFRFVKSLILAGCGESTEFPEYFASNTEDKFMQIMRAVGL